ncbi:MAG: hypothetical protein VX768_01335, partial [Planctomycetota bacterium]|nr:hypothetical protein [Planctomycetota bacterium]
MMFRFFLNSAFVGGFLLLQSVAGSLVGQTSELTEVASRTAQGQADKKQSSPKVLYVTSLPGTYHDYVTQREIFLETAEKAGWRVTVMIGDYKTLDSKGHPVKQPQKPVARGKTPEAIQRY